jgi:hypothetical protein
MGKEFTPKLVEFYNSCCRPGQVMEIVFVSSDDTREQFHETFRQMPWLAIDGDEEGARIKHNLATHLKVYRLPSLVVLDTQTGNFVTDYGRRQVQELFRAGGGGGDDGNKTKNGTELLLDVDRGRALVERWLTQEPEQIGHADTFANSLYESAMHFKRHPMYVVGIVCLLLFTNTIRRASNNPLLGMALCYLLLRIGKEPLDKNIPYIEQRVTKTGRDEADAAAGPDGGAGSTAAAAHDTDKKNE